MLYYRVKKEFDGKQIFTRSNGGYWELCTELVRNALYTARELEKLGIPFTYKGFEPIEISRKKIYFCFGLRFGFDKGYND